MTIRWRDEHGKEWTTHEGLVISVEPDIMRVMSDIYADVTYANVWNPETEKVDRVLVGMAFECFHGPWGKAEADADDTIHEFIARQKAEREAARIAAAHEREAARPAKGKTLRVVKGRKVPVGTTGECIWEGPDKYRAHARRVGIKDASGTVYWVAAEHVEVVRETPEDEERARYEEDREANRFDAAPSYAMTAAPEPTEPIGPPPGSWAETARLMARSDPDFDWDSWKDQMKEGMLW